MMKRQMRLKWTIGIAGLFVLFLATVLFLHGDQTSSISPPLTEMNSKALSALQADFNQRAGSVRIVLLLSPT